MSDIDPTQYLPTRSAKDKERAQIRKDIEDFLLAGGEIEDLPPMKITRNNTANVKKSTE